MSESPEIKPVPPTPAPTLGVRKLWWWGIYLAGFIIVAPTTPQTFFLFPLGLADDFQRLYLRLAGPSALGYAGRLILATSAFAFAIFIYHYWETMRVTTYRRFVFLMVVLTLLVAGSMAGCHNMAIDDRNHPLQ